MNLSASIRTGLGLLACAALLLGHRGPPDVEAAGAGSCVDCHTNLKKRIRLCWKLADGP